MNIFIHKNFPVYGNLWKVQFSRFPDLLEDLEMSNVRIHNIDCFGPLWGIYFPVAKRIVFTHLAFLNLAHTA